MSKAHVEYMACPGTGLPTTEKALVPGDEEECSTCDHASSASDGAQRSPAPSHQRLLKLHLALSIITAVCAAVALVVLYREVAFQRESVADQLRNLSARVQTLTRDLASFAQGEYVEFVNEPQNQDQRVTHQRRRAADTKGHHQLRPPLRKRLPAALQYFSDDRHHTTAASPHHNNHNNAGTSFPTDHRSTSSSDASSVAQSDAEFVWLTSKSRIPLYVLKEFCQATRSHCMQDMEALLSHPEVFKRLKGDKGERGNTGPAGHCSCPSSTARRSVLGAESVLMGTRGPPGPRGAKGERGPPGPPGVCAIKCIDEDILPRSHYYPSSANLITTHHAPLAGDQVGSHVAPQHPLLTHTTVNPYLASLTTTTADPLHHLYTSTATPTELELPEPPQIWTDKDYPPEDVTIDPYALLSTTSATHYPEHHKPPPDIVETPEPELPQPEYQTTDKDHPTEHSTHTSPHIPSRKRSCLIEAIGKPVLLRSSPDNEHTTAWGAVMRDAHPLSVKDGTKYYLTEQFHGRELIEYATAEDFKLFRPTFTYSLPKPFRGVGHVVFNGSFYYHVDTQPVIVRFELASEKITARRMIERISYHDGKYIYNLKNSYDYMDFAVDEHGLWLIYTVDSSSNTMVSHLHPVTLEPIFTRNISFAHTDMGNAFVACGMFYGISTVHFPYSHVVLTYDLFNDHYHEPPKGVLFTNPKLKSVMVDYSPRDRKLYAWDNGWQLMYPIKFSTATRRRR